MQLIGALSFWVPMPRSLGDKRRQIPPDKARDILKILSDYQDGDTRIVSRNGNQEEMIVSRVFPTTHFGFRKVTVERPLRLNFQASTERIGRIEEGKGISSSGHVTESVVIRRHKRKPRALDSSGPSSTCYTACLKPQLPIGRPSRAS